MLENVSVGVVEGARVKGVLGVSVRPREQGRGFKRFFVRPTETLARCHDAAWGGHGRGRTWLEL